MSAGLLFRGTTDGGMFSGDQESGYHYLTHYKPNFIIWRWNGSVTALLLPIYPAWYIGVVTVSLFLYLLNLVERLIAGL